MNVRIGSMFHQVSARFALNKMVNKFNFIFVLNQHMQWQHEQKINLHKLDEVPFMAHTNLSRTEFVSCRKYKFGSTG